MSRRRRSHTITKAAPKFGVGNVPATTFTPEQVAALLNMRTSATPLPREPMSNFGPGMPVVPSPLDPVNPNTGRAQPRIYEYPVSVNLPGITDRITPWKVLRDAAEAPVVRDCIRIRKNQIAALGWDIVISKRALQQYKKEDPDTSSVKINQELRKRLNPDVARLVEFWQMPDFHQGETFVEWAGKALEEHLVLDALSIYPFKDRKGERVGLRILDGSSIKVLRDNLGGRPVPPFPAFQQMLWGFPRGEFTADMDPDGSIPGSFPADRLIYRRREVRTWTPYGFSSTEQALQSVDLFLRRMDWDKSQYTDGVQPAGWIKNTGVESWTPQQLMAYNQAFNELYAGQTLNRMRYHLLPPGMEPMEAHDHPEKFKPDYHLHLIKLVAMHFDMTIAELGFTEAKGLGSSGYHEGQENVLKRKATDPDLRWLQAVLTEISRNYLDMPWELEFRFLGLDDADQAAADEVLENQVRSGRITVNESREELGRAPFAFAEADMPLIQTNRGMLFLQDASQLALPGELIQPSQQTDAERTKDQEAAGIRSPETIRDQKVKESEKVKEVSAYQKWLRNDHSTNRSFVFKHLTKAEALVSGVDLTKAEFEAEDDPKVAGRDGSWTWS